jgi:hypothetical protein
MALSPKGYGKTCTMTMLGAGLNKSNWTDTTSNAIKDLFEESVDYRIVYRNMDYSYAYKTWIYEGNAGEKTVGYLHLLSYPYDSVRFKIGDYIQFNYYHTNDEPSKYKYWLLQSLDCRHLYNVHGRMLPCNQVLRWEDNGVVHTYPCYFNTEMTKTNILDSGQGFNVESGALIAIVQQNEYTSKIYVNQRFVLNGRTYIVYQYNDNIDEGLIYVYLRITAELPEDDLDGGVAYNGAELINDNMLNGNIINIADVTSLRQGEQTAITLYHYTLGRKDDDVFEVVPYDVPSNYYSINNGETNIGNDFVIVNNKQYTKNPLKLEFENLTTHETMDVYIWLGGAL